MKTSKKVIGFMLVLGLLMFSSKTAQCQEFFPNEKIIFKAFPAEDAQTIIVLIGNLINKKTTIILYDKKGWVVFRMTLKNEKGYAARFDLSALHEKEYSLSVVQKGIKYTQFFCLSEFGPIMGNLEKYCFGIRTILKPAPNSIMAQVRSEFN